MGRNAMSTKKTPITRNRETLTCFSCQRRKLKCDKQLPCSSCVKRNDATSCSYAKTTTKEDAKSSRSDKVQARLQHLEQLVQEFAHTRSSSAETHSISQINGAASTTNGYAGATHYLAILEDIGELRLVLGEEEPESAPHTPPSNEAIEDESGVLFGAVPRLSLSAILTKHLPDRKEVDRRLAAYFRAEAIAAPFLHVPQFMRQYEQFWTDSSSASPLWISMLFSICRLSQSMGSCASLDERLANGTDESHTARKTNHFSMAAAHCLALGRYSHPQRFAVEALGIYIQARLIHTLDPSSDIGIVFGTLVQVAYSMGYHRDPRHSKQVSAFETEMRRRTWSFVMQLDLLVSFQLGLPNNVQFSSWDTASPSNLKDTDFDEGTAVLPPPRPQSEVTKTTFYTAKHMLMTIFDKILQHALAASQPRPEHELLALDAELHATYRSIPSVFHYKSISSSIADPEYLVVTRKCIELMYRKCICVLHRKYITYGRLESVRICFDAASVIVSAFLEMYPEFKPGGQFYADRWLLGSITFNDFLLGIMVLCLVLCNHKNSPRSTLTTEDEVNLLQMLRSSHEVCLENLHNSLGARRTSRLLDNLLVRFEEAQIPRDLPITPDTAQIVSPMTTQQSATQPEYQVYAPENDFTETSMADLGGWYQPWSNVFDTQEWSFLENALNMDFMNSL